MYGAGDELTVHAMTFERLNSDRWQEDLDALANELQESFMLAGGVLFAMALQAHELDELQRQLDALQTQLRSMKSGPKTKKD